MPACQIHKKYEWLKCNREALAEDTEGLCLLHSKKEDKDPEGFTRTIKAKLDQEDYDFHGVVFPAILGLLFFKHEFIKDADFSFAVFQGEAVFSEAAFKGEAIFPRARFQGAARFSWAAFQGEASFLGAIFEKYADFRGTAFQGEANLYESTFQGEADFSFASFYEEADFSGATFKGAATFFWATFHGEVEFVNLNPPQEGQPPPVFIGEFYRLSLGKEAVLRFQDVSLAWVKFSGTDMRRLTFQNIDWHSYHTPAAEFLITRLPLRWREWFRGRQAVFEEILLREKTHKALDLLLKYGLREARQKWAELRAEDYARVEELYQGLKQNYEKIGDYKRVGDFHYGEMEMHRLASPWRWLPAYWYNLYKFLSGYGERPLWAFILLLAFLFGLTGLAWSWGLAFNPGVALTTTPVSYWDALVFILEKTTLQRPAWLVPQNLVSRVLTGLSVLFIPGQAALFILALRNRLGRRR